MSSFQHTNPLWDFSLPPESLTSLPDDDFLAIIQSQMTNPSLVSDQSAFFIPHQISNDVPLSANPKSLTRIPNPPVVPTPSDSSPSPPSAQETTTSSRRDNPRRRSLGDDALKRKAYREQEEDDDDDDEQPSHRANPAERATKGNRRKSGGVPADEQRLARRKEQNRAAQRAFRERKEKHVRELEDQLAAMEAKHDQTQSENDNLKEMLRRLQTENVLLKQAAFTFSVPRAGDSISNAPEKPKTGDVQQKKQTTGSVSSTNTSPNSIFEDSFGELAGFSTPSSVTADSPKTFIASEPPKAAEVGRPTTQDFMLGNSPPDWLSSQSSDFMSPAQSPFTLISSNPAYMSYRDPSPSIPYAPETGSGSYGMFPSSSPYSGNAASPFASGSQQGMQPSSFTDFNFADFTMGTPGDMGSFNFDTTSPGGTNGTSLDDLFGGSATYNNLGAFSPYSVGTSPISHPGSSSGQSPPVPSPPAQSSSQAAHGDRCPSKEDLALFVAAAGPSSFAPQENNHMTVDGGKVIFHGSKLPPTDKNETNIDAYTAMQKLKTHPRYKECDMNELCAEFAAKARCDGSKAVIPQEGMNELMDRMSTGHNGQA